MRPLRLILPCLLAFSTAACGGSSAEEGGEADETGATGDTGDEGPACPMEEEDLTTEDIEPYFGCLEDGPCGSILQVWEFSLGQGFTASIAGYEEQADCWFEEFAKGTVGRYRMDVDFDGEPGYNTYDVYEGRMMERRQIDMTPDGIEAMRGPRNLASAEYWAACRPQWDGGEFLPECFYEGLVDCTAWGTEPQACGDEPGGGTGEDPEIDPPPVPWPDGGQYSGPCDSIGDCPGFGFGQSVTCLSETNTCTSACADASECDPAPEGDAVPSCTGGFGNCYLDCSGGQTCPAGMSCQGGQCGW